MAGTIDRVVHLTEESVERLHRLAADSGASEDALIQHALELFFAMHEANDTNHDRQAWSVLSKPSLDRVWDNSADSVYDNWKELYGVHEG